MTQIKTNNMCFLPLPFFLSLQAMQALGLQAPCQLVLSRQPLRHRHPLDGIHIRRVVMSSFVKNKCHQVEDIVCEV